MSIKVVHSGSGVIKVNVDSTPAISVKPPEVGVISVNPNVQGTAIGATGAQGPQGPAGNDGVTVTYTISAQDGDNSDEEKVRITGSDSNSSEVVLEAGTNLSIDRSGDKITFASTVTDAVLESDTSTSGFQFVVDDSTMADASETKIPTQRSVKGYVDSVVTSDNVTTDLSVSYGTDTVTVESSDGTDGIIEQASATKAGVMSSAQRNKLEGIEANADVTDSTSVGNAGAVMDDDFAQNGLMERTGSGSYTTVDKSTTSIPEGTNLYYTDARVDDRIAAASVGDLTDGGDVVFTTTNDVSSVSFVDTDDTFASATNNLVPSQLAVKTYVDNQLGTQNLSLGSVTGTTVAVDISDGTSVTLPAATTSAAGVMTEAQFDKLDAIEDNADVTDTANVTSAGALMDSEVTNLQDVKDFDPADYATAAQGTKADNALPKSGGTMTGNISFSGTQTVDGRDLSAGLLSLPKEPFWQPLLTAQVHLENLYM